MNSTISGVKARARLLMSHLDKVGKPITYSEALEALSASENKSDWNRYQASLKAARATSEDAPIPQSYQPHKIFAAGPGKGSGAIAEIVFAQNIEAGKIPIIILLRDQPFPVNKIHDSTGWLHIDIEYNQWHPTNLSAIKYSQDTKGVVIRPCIENWHHDKALDKEFVSAATLQFILRDIGNWEPELKKQLGTIILYGLERAEIREEVAERIGSPNQLYSKVLVNAMRTIRQHGGDQNLFIITESDLLKNDIARSRDEYKLILAEQSFGPTFRHCPVERLYVEDGNSVLTKWDNLFSNPHKVIEDICSFVGALSTSVAMKNIGFENATFEFVQCYLKEIMTQGFGNRHKTDKDMWEGRARLLLVMTEGAIKNKENTRKLTTAMLQKHLQLPNLHELFLDTTVDAKHRRKIGKYFQDVLGIDMQILSRNGFSNHDLLQHSYLTMQLPYLASKFNLT